MNLPEIESTAAENESAQEQPNDEESTDEKSANEKSAEEEPTDEESAGEESAHERSDEDAMAEAVDSPETRDDEIQALSDERIKSIVESILFAADKPLTPVRLSQIIDRSARERIEQALATLADEYQERGISLDEVAGGYQFRTRTNNAQWVQKLVAGRPVRLTRAQLETLSIIAYRQPTTRPEIDDIRGVDSGSPIRVLLERGIIRTLGKKEEPGRPMLYGTSKDFLEFFNLKDLRELPSLREYRELSPENSKKVDALTAEDATPPTGSAQADTEFSQVPLEQVADHSSNNDPVSESVA